ncbi:hypothetical protein DSO57_1007968 [Entomophthora muscae]|uniref:Uncharacterized protein n=1 Tax=Entomophthora muscae TaxID=34485 RepID=A0ACC2TI18_9FUNG|nr:hypothetical protein DSO57_1007968 [Entomophthora muscae]
MSLDDLAAHSAEEVKAISHKFHDKVQVYECPPNGQGLTVLIAVALLDALHEDKAISLLEDLDPCSPAYLHLLIEVLHIVFADIRQHITDPDFYHISASYFLDKKYLQSRAKLFDPNFA